MTEQAISVRELVEFTLHGEDIRPGNFRDMQEGTIGHKARQKNLQEGWQAEVPLKIEVYNAPTDIFLTVRGRMDGYFPKTDSCIPQIEEMKLLQGKITPEEAKPAHFAQCACYACMLMKNNESISEVNTIVSYISVQGSVRKKFKRTLNRNEAEEIFNSFYEPYLQWLQLISNHKKRRDENIHRLKFPYPAYRKGQREMSVQVYTAICRQRRLFAQMPTGTGKSMATIFPAVKALGEGKTERIYYLTSRTTQRKSALEAVELLKQQHAELWTLVINAKMKQCPTKAMCSPDFCPRAKGHFLRDNDAIIEMMECGDFSAEKISEVADKYEICPFEFSLSLSEIADLTVCDYNYALDPKVHIQRIFDMQEGTTLLIDEAHNLPSRLQDMTSATLHTDFIRQLRGYVGKNLGRKSDAYVAMSEYLKAVDDLPYDANERVSTPAQIPQSLERSVYGLLEAFSGLSADNFSWGILGDKYSDVLRGTVRFKWILDGDRKNYVFITQGSRNSKITAFALDVADYFASVTAKMSGTVCFSATLSPLDHTKRILGGEEEDATFAMQSPFNPENLLVLSLDVDTRYQSRETTAKAVASAIDSTYLSHSGHYIAFFPSFKYMEMVEQYIESPHQAQEKEMNDMERTEFLKFYSPEAEPVLSLCVMGGNFSEGIDLPGDALTGVIIVGVGLPQVNIFQEKMMEFSENKYGNGFLHTYMIPGIQKVTQAVGRVIRTENDRGVAVLIDARYSDRRYRVLCPSEWNYRKVDLQKLTPELQKFWHEKEENSEM